jgi:RNA polymerase sigma-70 factor (ECF subfamily)
MDTATTYTRGAFDAQIDFLPSCPDLGAVWARVFRSDTASSANAVPEQEIDDQTWIAKVRAGDEAASRALIERLYPTVIRLIRGRLPRRTSEEDLAQIVFAKIFRKLDQFSGAVPLEHWVSRIVVNTCLNQIHYEKVHPELRMADLDCEEELVIRQLASTDDALPNSCSQAAREIVEKLLERLNPDDRLVITMLHLEERSVKEICNATGWSHTLVKVRAFRARAKMRKLLEGLLDGEEQLEWR